MPNELTNSSTSVQKTAVSTMLYYCGVSVDMMYETDDSSAYSEDVPYALKTYFKYSTDMSYGHRDDYDDMVWLARVKASLDLGFPAHYSGSRVTDIGGRSGHAFVCDGYDSGDLLHFNWGWNGGGNTYCAVNALNVDGRKYIYANYAIFNIHPSTDAAITHSVSVSSNNTDWGTVSGGGSFAIGVKTTVTATPVEGKVFCYWLENGGIVSTDNPYQLEVLYSRNLTAVFAEPNSIAITASALGNAGGTVIGGGDYSYGQEVTVKASNWTSGNKPGSDDIAGITQDVTVDENVTVATLNLYDGATLIIPAGKILTVTGTIAEMDDAKIVIEEGGQLVNSSYYVI